MTRQSFQIIYRKYKKIGKGAVRLTQSSLILLQPLSITKSSYDFPVLENETTTGIPNVDEIRLNINDEFISYQVGYYVVGLLSSPPEIPTTQKKFLTYAGVELSQTLLPMEQAWRGRLSILVNKINRVDKWDLLKHQRVSRTQWGVSSPVFPPATQPDTTFKEDGVVNMQPMVTLSGAKKNDVNVTLSATITALPLAVWAVPTGNINLNFQGGFLSLIFRGLLGQNASKFQ
jgi:hypothetical protein